MYIYGLKLLSGNFLNHYLPYLLKQCILLNPELFSPILVTEIIIGIAYLSLLCAGIHITDGHHSHHFFFLKFCGPKLWFSHIHYNFIH